ncbi:MAG: type II secretion system protein GspD [Planctomycetota bacterium]
MALVSLCLGGCGDFFTQKPTELQTQVILNELREIEENQNVKNPLPEIYRRPPEKIRLRDGVKVFYFCKHHPVDKLADLVNTQFSEFFRKTPTKNNPRGTEYPRPTYSVSPNAATNQLIVHCPNGEEADMVLEFLHKVDVAPIQVNVDCLILERFSDVTMDWETSIDIDNLFGEKITLGGKEGPEFPGASLREPRRAEFGLDVGYWNQKLSPHEFRVGVDLLVSRGYLRILMNPKLETINGQTATITAREFAPLEKILSQPGFNEPFNLTDYQWVEDKLEVTPHVYADGSIGLETYVMLGSRSKPEGVVQTSIITERFVRIGENRIEPGHSLVIGGIRKSEERSVIRGVPVLKDIPVVGILFSSKDFEEKATEVIFILTPSISSGGVEYAEMLERVKQKRAKPEYETGLQEAITDPLGTAAYTEHVEQQAARAEFEWLKAEIEKAQALEQVDQIKQRLLQTAEQVISEKAKAAKAHLQALKAEEEAHTAKKRAEKAKEEADRAKAEAEQAKKKTEKAEAENHKLKSETEKAKANAGKVKVEAKDTHIEPENAPQEDEKVDAARGKA